VAYPANQLLDLVSTVFCSGSLKGRFTFESMGRRLKPAPGGFLITVKHLGRQSG
jgi:hypothetical protein